MLSLISLKPTITREIPNKLKYKPYDFLSCDFYGIDFNPTINYKNKFNSYST